jgi:hypothetical protein
LADGRPSLLIDPGSVGNLCGDNWAKEVAKAAARNGQKPSYEKRSRPLKVSGVGSGTQACVYDCKLPVAFRRVGPSGGLQPEAGVRPPVSVGHITTPTVSYSDLPGLLGLTALRKSRAIFDFNTLQLHFCGPDDYNRLSGLLVGTTSFQCTFSIWSFGTSVL